MRRSLRNKKIFRIIYFLILILLILFPFLFIQTTKIKEVKIFNEKKEKNIYGLNWFIGKDLYLLSDKEIKQNLFRNNPVLKEIRIEREFPNILILNLSWSEPIVSVKADKGYFLIDDQGKIVNKTQKQENLQFPVINFYQTIYYNLYSLGNKINFNEIILIIPVIKKLNLLGHQIDTIDIHSRDMIGLKLKDKEIYLSLEKKMDIQLYQLEYLLKNFKITGRDFKVMDLRFKNPLIR